MIEYVLVLALALSIYAYYRLMVKPQKIMKKYVKLFESAGYKVKTYPFSLLKSTVLTQVQIGIKEHGDCHYVSKHSLPGVDVGIWNVLNIPVIEIVSPQLLKEFFQPDKTHYYEKVPLIVANFQRVLGHGIAFSEGNEWKKKRKIMNNVFNYEFINSIIPKIIRIINKCFDNMEKKNKDNENSKVVKFQSTDIFASILAHIMLECFFGCSSVEEEIDGVNVATFVNKLNGDVNQQTYSPASFFLGTKFLEMGLREKDKDINRRIKIFRNFAKLKIQERIDSLKKQGEQRIQDKKYSDIIEALVQGQQLNSKNDQSLGQGYHINELVEQFMTFFAGGTDTTNHFIEMMIYYVHSHPEVERRMLQEIRSVVKSDEDITPENLKKIKYIDWIQNQTTRMYGPGTGLLLRNVVKDHFLAEIPIQKDIAFTIQPIGSHYNEKYYKKPFEFRPERWENQTKGVPAFAFGGFSAGPRSCIGKHLAMLESKIALIKLYLRYPSFKFEQDKIILSFKFLAQPDPSIKIIADLPH